MKCDCYGYSANFLNLCICIAVFCCTFMAVATWRNSQSRAFALSAGTSREGARGAQFPGRRIIAAGRKVPKLAQVLSSTQYICFRKNSGSKMGRQTCFLPQAPCSVVTPLSWRPRHYLNFNRCICSSALV